MCPECNVNEVPKNRKFCSILCSRRSAVRIATAKRHEKANGDVTLICQNSNCNKEFTVAYNNRNKKYCCWDCKKQSPRERKLSSERMKSNNPMKNLDVAKRMSKTRRECVTSDPEYRKKSSKRMKDAWRLGKYDGVATGKCKWYDHIKSNGTTVKLQGTWEVAYARFLDENNIAYESHKGRIEYLDKDGSKRSYYPDFHLIDTDEYVDVKGEFWNDEQRIKIECIKDSNPGMKLIIFRKEDFEKNNIDLIKIQTELLTMSNNRSHLPVKDLRQLEKIINKVC